MKRDRPVAILFSLFTLMAGCKGSSSDPRTKPAVGVDQAVKRSLSLQTFDVSDLVDAGTNYRLIAEVSGEQFKGHGFSGADYTHVTMTRSAKASECIAVFHNDEKAFSGVLSISPHEIGDWWTSSDEPHKEGKTIVLCKGGVKVFLEPN